MEWKIEHNELDVDSDSLGCGTFGVVHKGIWKNTDVAIKFFNNKTISSDPSFKRETEILRSLNHKNIIKLFGMGEKGKQHFMVMELAPLSLDYVIHDAKSDYDYDYANVLHWTLQIAEALDYCHNRDIKVIHRDIKPPNMLLFDDGMLLKVCDFGTAKLVDTSTLPDTFIGTPYYLAPEIMEGKHSHKCDIFSFAVTVWEMVSRHKPTLNLNTKERLHPYTIFMNIGKGERPPRIIGMPKLIDDLINRCWAQSPDDRPSAEHIVYQLKKVLVQIPNHKSLKKKGEDHTDSKQYNYGAGISNNYNAKLEEEEDSTLSEPVRATEGSEYYMHALPQDQQPFIPIPNCRESEELYERYCSYMLQTAKAQNELNSLLRQQEQLTQQFDSELFKQSTLTDRMMRSKTLSDERIKLEQYLSQLKMS